MTIHSTDPFATPEEQRSPVRRMRGRLASPVTLWTALRASGARAGLTVSSTLVVDGRPGRLLGLVDDESELWAAARESGRFAVAPLNHEHRQLADRFAGLMPAPGGLFAADDWVETEWGPVLAGTATWAGCQVEEHRRYGWALLVEATIAHVQVGHDEPPLLHYRGRYRELHTP